MFKEHKFYGLMEKDMGNYSVVFFPCFEKFNHPNMIVGGDGLESVAKESIKALVAHFLENNLTIPISENFKGVEFVVTAHILISLYLLTLKEIK